MNKQSKLQIFLVVVFLGIGFVGGILFNKIRKTETPAVAEVKSVAAFNPVVEDKNFVDSLKSKKLLLVAPASALAPEKIKQLQSLTQLNIVIPENTFSDAIIFHSNSDQNRLELLRNALSSPSKDTIVWGFRGGYGSARLVEMLKSLPKPVDKKIFIGYSDMTVVHLFLSQNWGWQSINGAMLAELLNPNKDPQNFQKVANIINHRDLDVNIENLKPLNNLAEQVKEISGLLTGGNLTSVETSLGTDWQIQADEKIIFLEDTGVKGYQVDRTLTHLTQAGVFKGVKAIVLGNFIEEDEFVKLAISRFASEINIPVFQSDQFGHGKVNSPLVYNAKSEIVLEPNTKTFKLTMHPDLPKD